MTTAIDTTTFPCGHPRSPENTAPNHSRPSGRCRTCINGSRWRRKKSRCYKGHELTTDNTVVVEGRERCVECRRAANRKAKARERMRRQFNVEVDGSQVTATVLSAAKGWSVDAPDLSWTPQARCKGASRDVESAQDDAFFKEEGERGVPERALAASKRYCSTCPVAQQCGAAATEVRWEGLWGGSWRATTSDGKYRIIPLVPAAAPEAEAA